MSGNRALSRAARLLKARRFSEAIAVLEPQVFLYRDNFAFYSLLGTACLYAGDFGGAFSYLQRANQLNPKDVSVLIGLAAVQLRRRQIPDSLRYWLGVLDIDPRNTRAKRGLELVKQNRDPAEFVTMAESGKLRAYYPSLGFRVPTAVIWTVPVAALAAIVVLTWPVITGLFDRTPTPVREGSTLFEFADGSADVTDYSGDFRYVLTPAQIEQTFESVGEYFNTFRDNLAQREVNRLLNSNAGQLIKERSQLLEAYFREPTFVTFGDNFSFADVAAEPWLYDRCYVRWSGQVSNVDTAGPAIQFVLLVGYEQERVLEGTIPVTVPFAADVQSGPIELIGRIRYEDGALGLTATSIRRIAPGRP